MNERTIEKKIDHCHDLTCRKTKKGHRKTKKKNDGALLLRNVCECGESAPNGPIRVPKRLGQHHQPQHRHYPEQHLRPPVPAPPELLAPPRLFAAHNYHNYIEKVNHNFFFLFFFFHYITKARACRKHSRRNFHSDSYHSMSLCSTEPPW